MVDTRNFITQARHIALRLVVVFPPPHVRTASCALTQARHIALRLKVVSPSYVRTASCARLLALCGSSGGCGRGVHLRECVMHAGAWDTPPKSTRHRIAGAGR